MAEALTKSYADYESDPLQHARNYSATHCETVHNLLEKIYTLLIDYLSSRRELYGYLSDGGIANWEDSETEHALAMWLRWPWVVRLLDRSDLLKASRDIAKRKKAEHTSTAAMMASAHKSDSREESGSKTRSEKLTKMPSDPTDVEMAQLWGLYHDTATSINHLLGAMENNQKESKRLLSWNTEQKHDPEVQKLSDREKVKLFCKQKIKEFNPIQLRKDAIKRIENYRQTEGQLAKEFLNEFEQKAQALASACSLNDKKPSAAYVKESWPETAYGHLQPSLEKEWIRAHVGDTARDVSDYSWEEFKSRLIELDQLVDYSRRAPLQGDRGGGRNDTRLRGNTAVREMERHERSDEEELQSLQRVFKNNRGIWKLGDRWPLNSADGKKECVLTYNGHTCSDPACRRGHTLSRPGVQLGQRIEGAKTVRQCGPDTGTNKEKLEGMEQLQTKMASLIAQLVDLQGDKKPPSSAKEVRKLARGSRAKRRAKDQEGDSDEEDEIIRALSKALDKQGKGVRTLEATECVSDTDSSEASFCLMFGEPDECEGVSHAHDNQRNSRGSVETTKSQQIRIALGMNGAEASGSVEPTVKSGTSTGSPRIGPERQDHVSIPVSRDDKRPSFEHDAAPATDSTISSERQSKAQPWKLAAMEAISRSEEARLERETAEALRISFGTVKQEVEVEQAR